MVANKYERELADKLNADQLQILVTPQLLKSLLSVNLETQQFITDSRTIISKIIKNQDARLLIVVGPCSIHDPIAALEYAEKLKALADSVQDHIVIVMRVYFAKPRTSIGWQGYINDPLLNNSNLINDGLYNARELLIKINQLGLATATEFLDTITPQYIIDLISWAAIGARTVESQAHRNFVSGLSIPVGFKNSTTGKINSALDALVAASQPNISLTIDDDARASIIQTQGNVNTHIVLRGGDITGPNYYTVNVLNTIAELNNLNKHNINTTVMIDCSHGNSEKNHNNQKLVFNNIIKQLKQEHGKHIKGIMLESFLKSGRQDLTVKKLEYGVSVTDSCIGWDDTYELITNLNNILK